MKNQGQALQPKDKSKVDETSWTDAIVSANNLIGYFGIGMWSYLTNKKVLLTQEQYDSLKTKEPDTLYLIKKD